MSYVATTEYGWGRGFTEEEAILAALGNTRPDDDTDVRLWTWEVEGFEDVWPGGVEADEVLDERTYLLSGGVVNAIKELDGRLERVLDDELANADSEF
jgi:hypothetical protein